MISFVANQEVQQQGFMKFVLKRPFLHVTNVHNMSCLLVAMFSVVKPIVRFILEKCMLLQ